MRIGIIAALPGELRPLVRSWERIVSPTKGISIWVKRTSEDELIAVCGGMGTAAAIRSFAAAEQFGTLDMVFSVGWAGALAGDVVPEGCYAPAEVIDSMTGERYASSGGELGRRLVTTHRVAGKEEKLRLRDAYGASLVDMEASAVARLAHIRQIPLYCFKAVSDGMNAELPDMNPFIDASGQLRMAAFAGHLFLRPRYWSALISLGINSNRAAKALAVTIAGFIDERNAERTDRRGTD